MSRFSKSLFFIISPLLIVAVFFVTGPKQQESGPQYKQSTSAKNAESNSIVQVEKTVSPEFISNLMAKEKPQDESAEIFYQTLPGSLSDAPKPAALESDAEGNLIINQRVQRLFEFYLMAMGEEPIESIIARIKYDLHTQLGDQAYLLANNLLEGYLQYRNNIGIIKNQYAEHVAISGNDMQLIKEIKLAIRDSRSDFLPDEAISSFYSQEDDYDDYMISKIQILSDQTLSAEEKRTALILLDENSPTELVHSQKKAKQLSGVSNSVKELRKLGASNEVVYIYREQELGTEAADRLTTLDTERNAWQSRIDTYRIELNNIESMNAYSETEKQGMIDALRHQHFDTREILRVRTLDKMRGMPSI